MYDIIDFLLKIFKFMKIINKELKFLAESCLIQTFQLLLYFQQVYSFKNNMIKIIKIKNKNG